MRSFKADGEAFELEYEELELTNCEKIKDVIEDFFVKRVGKELFDFQF